MRDRIVSLETEYAVSFRPEKDCEPPPNHKIVETLRRLVVKDHGMANSSFLVNGSRFYHDDGHAEWAQPECLDERQAAVYDKAADSLLGDIVPLAQRQLIDRGYRGRLMVVKNNADAQGNSYGCHENYLVEREAEWLRAVDYLRLTARYLIPFLVTRQVLCGSGRVGLGRTLEDGCGFQISQRADFIGSLVASDTSKERPIVNTKNEDEPLTSGNFRRLHLILGDANMSVWATRMKLGTTGLVLRAMEDFRFGDIPQLSDPVQAVKTISRDPSCTTTVPLRNADAATAIDIQRIYLDQVKSYLDDCQASAIERETLSMWEGALLLLERNPLALVDKVDWITKKHFMDRYLARKKLRWEDGLEDNPVFHELLRMDIDYHNLSKKDGLYHRITGGKTDVSISEKAIRCAQTTPPPFTRAKARGEAISAAAKAGARIEAYWNRLDIGGENVMLSDPYQFFSPELCNIFSNGQTALKALDLDTFSEVYDNLKEIIAKVWKVKLGMICLDEDFRSRLGVKSPDLAALVHAYEEEFGVEIWDENLPPASTVGRAVSFISERLENGRDKNKKEEKHFFKIPSHPNTAFDEDYFLSLLEGSLSTPLKQKQEVIDSIPRLRMDQINELISIFEEENQKFSELKADFPQDVRKIRMERKREFAKASPAQGLFECANAEAKLEDKDFPEKMTDHVLYAIEENNPTIRQQAMQSLGDLGSKEHVWLLKRALYGEKTPEILLKVVESLGKIGGNDAVDALLDLPGRVASAVREKAGETLEELLSEEKE